MIVHPRGCHASKAIIENLNIANQHRFGIETVGLDGRTSELSEIMYEGTEEASTDDGENSDTESEMDLNQTLNVDEYKTGSKRTVSRNSRVGW